MRKVITAAIAVGSIMAAMALVAPAASATSPYDCDGPEDPFFVIVGSRDADRLVGTDCNDSVFARAGDDVVRGKLGYDVLRGQSGDDRLIDLSFLVGGVIRGGRGFDTCIVVDDSPVQLVSCEEIIEVG